MASWCTAADKAALAASGLAEAAVSVLCQNHESEDARRMLATATVEESISALLTLGEGLEAGTNAIYTLWAASLVVFMQAGFAMLCAGSIRAKNVKNILLKNVLDAAVGLIFYFMFGYGVAYGRKTDDPGNRFIGEANFALGLSATDQDWLSFLFQWSFAAAAATITSGAMAERTQFAAYLGYSALLTGFVYPVVTHWAWDSKGWLASGIPYSTHDSTAFVDLAGSGVVHLVGGCAGLMGAIMVGPRTGRFDAEGRPIAMPGHNAALVVLGTFILWVGWYGFNCGSVGGIASTDDVLSVGRVAVTTTLSAAAGGVTSLFLNFALYKVWDLIAVCNGVLAGLVSITAGCAVMDTYTSIFTGFVGALVLFGAGKLLLKLRIDDPLEAFPVHGACGAWGCIAVGLFAKQKYLNPELDSEHYGCFMGGNGKLLGVQLAGVIVIILWTCSILGPFFFGMKQAGLLRTSAEEEAAGLDESKHGGSAYNNA